MAAIDRHFPPVRTTTGPCGDETTNCGERAAAAAASTG
jgi:hypothetical protein